MDFIGASRYRLNPHMLYRYRRPLSKDFMYFCVSVLGWALWAWRGGNLPTFGAEISKSLWAFGCWTILTSVATIMALYWVDFFRPFKLFKFIPDLISIWFVTPIVGILCKPVIGFIFQTEFIRTREVLVGSFVPALVGVLGEALGSWAKSRSSVKSTVYLALTPGEKERFIESIQTGGWDKHYRILTHEEFNGALISGGRVDYVIISRTATKDFILHQNILQAHMRGVCILDYRTLLNQMRGHISVNDTDIWTFLAGSLRQSAFDALYRNLKFYLEPVVAAVMLILLAPLFLIVAIVIKATSPGPVFYCQRRTGYLGADFFVVKFRSMRMDAENSGVKWASKTDDRVTPMGRFLRKSRIDELPQLWNVLRGEMSFMGPRPERPEFYKIIEAQVPHFKLRLLVRPGITGWAQLLGGYAASIEESERKLEYDLYYMQYLSPRMDLVILGRTILTLVKGNSGQ